MQDERGGAPKGVLVAFLLWATLAAGLYAGFAGGGWDNTGSGSGSGASVGNGILGLGTATADGTSATAARVDHQHAGPTVYLDGASGAVATALNLIQGLNLTITRTASGGQENFTFSVPLTAATKVWDGDTKNTTNGYISNTGTYAADGSGSIAVEIRDGDGRVLATATNTARVTETTRQQSIDGVAQADAVLVTTGDEIVSGNVTTTNVSATSRAYVNTIASYTNGNTVSFDDHAALAAAKNLTVPGVLVVNTITPPGAGVLTLNGDLTLGVANDLRIDSILSATAGTTVTVGDHLLVASGKILTVGTLTASTIQAPGAGTLTLGSDVSISADLSARDGTFTSTVVATGSVTTSATLYANTIASKTDGTTVTAQDHLALAAGKNLTVPGTVVASTLRAPGAGALTIGSAVTVDTDLTGRNLAATNRVETDTLISRTTGTTITSSDHLALAAGKNLTVPGVITAATLRAPGAGALTIGSAVTVDTDLTARDLHATGTAFANTLASQTAGTTVSASDHVGLASGKNLTADKIVTSNLHAQSEGTTLTADDNLVLAANKNITLPSTGRLALQQMSPGSVLFYGDGGSVAQDNAALYWDRANDRLGVGTTAPEQPIHASANFNGGFGIRATNAAAGASAQAIVIVATDAGYVNAGYLSYHTSSFGAGTLDLPDQLELISKSGATNGMLIDTAAGPIVLATGGVAAGNERMRADTSGVTARTNIYAQAISARGSNASAPLMSKSDGGLALEDGTDHRGYLFGPSAGITTTDATPTLVKTSYGGNPWPISSNTVVGVEFDVVGRRTDGGGNAAVWIKLEVLAANDAGTSRTVGSVLKTVVARDNGSVDANAAAVDATDTVDVSVTGANTYMWNVASRVVTR